MPVTQAASPLPDVDLSQRRIAIETLRFIPLSTVEKYQVAAFEVNEATLKLALVYPEQLKQGFMFALDEIGKKVGKKVELYRTSSASMQQLIKQYREATRRDTAPAPKAGPTGNTSAAPATPPLFEVGKTVVYNYLKRIPYEFSKEHRVVCVDFFPPNIYWFAFDKAVAGTEKAVTSYIEEHNHIRIHTLSLETEEFNRLLDYYKGKHEEEQALEKELQKKQQAEYDKIDLTSSETAEEHISLEEPKLAKGVIVPDLPAKIVSTEEEKKGLAGLVQKVSQSLGGSKVDDAAIIETVPPEPVPEIKPEPSTSALPPLPPLPEAGAVQDKPAPVSNTAVVKPAETPANQGKPTDEAAKEDAVKPAEPETKPAETPAATPAVAATPPKTPEKSQSHNPLRDENTEIGKLLDKQVETQDELAEFIKKGFVPRIVAATVSFAIHEKASDIHIEVFNDEVRIRFRIDGQLIDIVKLPPDIHAAIVSRIKILSKLRLDETRVPQDGRFDVNFNEAQVDVRVSIMPTVHGEKVVMRILDKSRSIATLDRLGLEGLAYDNLIQAIQKPYGICLATGPTGSGKSTSLYAILGMVATTNVNVTTLEDPVEYEMKGINQSQIRPKIGFTFAEGLRSILRQDPNIIMVGEIRDGETANMATQAALTGHLVLSTLHTNDASGAIPRLNNMGIEPFLITSSLNVVMGQRLVRKICQKCKQVVNMPAGVHAKIEQDIADIVRISPKDASRIKQPVTFYQGAGCSECGGKGYSGRLGIYEVLPMSDAIEELTLKHASSTDLQVQAQKEGMITMYQDGLIKVTQGITTLDEVLRETTNK